MIQKKRVFCLIKKKVFSHNSGLSLVELMIVVMISGIVAYGASSLLSGVTERNLRSDADLNVASLSKLLQKTASRSLQTLTISKFNSTNSYKYANQDWSGGFSTLSSFTSESLIDWNSTANKDLYKKKLDAEPSNSFKSDAQAYLNSITSFNAGSFELFVENVEKTSSSGSLIFWNSSVLISRCIPEGRLLSDGARIDLNAPLSSMLYLLSVKTKPFLIQSGKEWIVRCANPETELAKINALVTNRDAEFTELSKWRLGVFQIKLDSSFMPTAILELNAPAEISPNFGAGFMLSFNEDVKKDLSTNKPFAYAPGVKLSAFVVHDKCLGTSFGRRPTMEMSSCIRITPTFKSTNVDPLKNMKLSEYLGQALDVRNSSIIGSLNVDSRQGTSILLGPGRKVSN